MMTAKDAMAALNAAGIYVKYSEAHYACGPLRETHEEAAADARVFQRLPAIRQAVSAARKDPDRLGISCLTLLCRELEIEP